MLAGRHVRGLDQTGLSQKAGPVMSDLRITTGDTPSFEHANVSGVDCLLAFDLLVGASDWNLADARADRTVVVASTDSVPTGQMVTQPEIVAPTAATLTARLAEVSRRGTTATSMPLRWPTDCSGRRRARTSCCSGAAVQAGAVPVPPAAIEQAIELNGVAVATNLAAFRWGRAWHVDPAAVERAADLRGSDRPETVDELVDRLADDLVDYQSPAYAERFRAVVAAGRHAERAAMADSTRYTAAVARNLHKLMAYKDEYEVARLC